MAANHNHAGYIDIYCERLQPGLFDEPLNAISNAAFIIAGLLFYRWYRGSDPMVPWQSGLMVLVGLCSLAFHMMADLPSMFADILSILLFILLHVYLASRRFMPQIGVFGAVVVALVTGAASNAIPPSILMGSAGYFPALLALVIFGLIARNQHREATKSFFIAAGLFVVSLTLRTIDRPLCEAFPLGTHPAWHLLNGMVLFFTAQAVLRGVRK